MRSHHHAYARRCLPQDVAWFHDRESIERYRLSCIDHSARGDNFTETARTSGMGLRAIGLNADSERVLRFASQAAKDVHANLTLVHVILASGADLLVQLDLEERLQSAKREAASRRI